MATFKWDSLDNLILVAGHAVYVSDNVRDPGADSSWCLQEFQKGEPPFYIEHIREGARLADDNRSALLVFSGGQTRAEAGPRSEGLSYWLIAEHFSWWQRGDVSLRTTTEEYARDSFENVLFGICRFWECTGKPPSLIKVVSWAFKRRRFAMHIAALRFPVSRFEFIGANDPVDLAGAEEGEQKAVALFESDPYGTGPVLGKKRDERNPFNRTHPYAVSCPVLEQLLRHKGPDVFAGPLPW